MIHALLNRRNGRRVCAGSVAAAAAAALVVSALGAPAQAVSPNGDSGDFRIVTDGYYATARIDFAGDIPLPLPVPAPDLEGHLTVGQINSEVDSQGVEGEAEGVYSGAFGELIAAEGLGIELDTPYDVGQVALPEEDEPATGGFHGLEVPIVGSVDAISGEVKANWNDDLVGPNAEGGVLTSLYSGVGQLDLVEVGELGPLTKLLPVDLPLSDPLVSVGAGQLLQETGTFAKDDGSLGAYAEVSGRFGDVNVLGGAASGGISIGVAGSDDGETPNSYGRLEATGEPGGASFDYDLPALEVKVGDDEVISLEPGVDRTVELTEALSLNVNVAEYREEDTVLADDGTLAEASGGGVALRLTIVAPVPLLGEVEVGSAEVGLLSFPEVSVEVPQGGINGEGDITFEN